MIVTTPPIKNFATGDSGPLPAGAWLLCARIAGKAGDRVVSENGARGGARDESDGTSKYEPESGRSENRESMESAPRGQWNR